jgi:hypothetical protein
MHWKKFPGSARLPSERSVFNQHGVNGGVIGGRKGEYVGTGCEMEGRSSQQAGNLKDGAQPVFKVVTGIARGGGKECQ